MATAHTAAACAGRCTKQTLDDILSAFLAFLSFEPADVGPSIEQTWTIYYLLSIFLVITSTIKKEDSHVKLVKESHSHTVTITWTVWTA